VDKDTQRYLDEAAALLEYKPNNDRMLLMHKNDSKTRLLLGGKRSGKSTFGVVETCWAALGIHPFLNYPPPPLLIRICAVDFIAGVKGIILPMLYKWLPPRAIKKYWSEDRILELLNGTLIDFKSYDQDLEKFEGVERHLVWMDEEPPKDVYQSNYMRTVSSGINGKLIISCTPLHGMTWLYDELYDNPEAKPPYVDHCHVTIFENPHLDAATIEGIKHDPAMRDNLDAALYGQFIAKTGLIYPEFNDTHIIQPRPISTEELAVVGIDPHDRNPMGVVFVALNRENEWIVFDEILENLNAAQLADSIKRKLGTRFPPNLGIIDTSAYAPQSIAGTSLADEMTQKYGIYLLQAHKDVQAGRLKVSTLLDPGAGKKPRLLIMRNCVNLIREFRHYIWDDWAGGRRDKKDPKEQPMKKDDHLLDALRYVCMSNIVWRSPQLKKVERKIPDKVSQTGYY
jgi:phage terminase large subunit-like protein